MERARQEDEQREAELQRELQAEMDVSMMLDGHTPLGDTNFTDWYVKKKKINEVYLSFLFFSDYLFKIFILGDSGVGKSNILQRYVVSNTFLITSN